MQADQQKELNNLLKGKEGEVHIVALPFSDRKGKVTSVMNQGIGIVDGLTYVEQPAKRWSHCNEEKFIEMNFMLEGSMYHTQGDLFKRRQLLPGYHNLLFNPFSREESELIGSGQFRHVGIHITIDRALVFFNEFIPRLAYLAEKIQKDDPFVIHAPSDRLPTKMKYLFDTMWAKPQIAGLSRLHFESINLELFALACESMLTVSQTPAHLQINKADTERLYYARELLLNRLSDPPMLREISLLCGINEFKLKRGFKQLFGKSVLAFVNEARLDVALHALYAGDKTISEIAYELGYSHAQHFHRAFKQRYGKTPKSIRTSG
jgi:AraC-like DNA-binding protein